MLHGQITFGLRHAPLSPSGKQQQAQRFSLGKQQHSTFCIAPAAQRQTRRGREKERERGSARVEQLHNLCGIYLHIAQVQLTVRRATYAAIHSYTHSHTLSHTRIPHSHIPHTTHVPQRVRERKKRGNCKRYAGQTHTHYNSFSRLVMPQHALPPWPFSSHPIPLLQHMLYKANGKNITNSKC